MTKKEFIAEAKAEINLNVYSIKRVIDRGYKGWEIEYSVQINDTTVTTTRDVIIMAEELSRAYLEFTCY